MHRGIPRSIGARLLLGVVLLSFTALAGSSVAVSLVFRHFLASRTDGDLHDMASRLTAALGNRDAVRVREDRFQSLVPGDTVVVLRSTAGSPLLALRAHGDEARRLAAQNGPKPATVAAGDRDLRAIAVPVDVRLEQSNGEQPPGLAVQSVVLAIDLTDDQETVRKLDLIEITACLVAMVFLLALTRSALRIGLRPLSSMATAAAAIAGGETAQRLPVPAGGEVAQLATTLNRALDERDHAEQGLRDFVAEASHELRTPLTLIHGWTDLCLHEGLGDPAATESALERISAETARMRSLIDELLLLARLDARVPLRHEPVDLAVVATEVVADMKVVEPDRAVDLEVEAPCVVQGDEHRLRQVLRNLVGNALQHSGDGARVWVTLGRAGDDALLTVSDDGSGVAAGELDRIFEPFHRAGANRTAGSGLGLAIVRAVVRAHGGTVRARTGDGGGTVFDIRLPADASVR